MAGLKYVGADYSSDNNVNDLMTKGDIDSAYANAPVSQTAVQSAINTAAGGIASTVSVNNALAAYIQANYLAAQETNLILSSQIGVAGGVAPLNSSGVIPGVFVPSLGAGYCLGPYGTTATFSGATGALPIKIADWNIGAPGITFQPAVFMSILAGASNGGRPVIEVRMSAGSNTYANQTLIARGVGRNNWNDLQTVNVKPVPAATGHTGVAGSGYSPTYNLWLSAWLYDANNQSVTIENNAIATAGAFLIRIAQ